jgi:glucan biosynthesis protein
VPAGRPAEGLLQRGLPAQTIPGQKGSSLTLPEKRLNLSLADKPLTAVVTVDPRLRLLEQQLYKNSVTGGWRLVFLVMTEEAGSIEKILPSAKRPALEIKAFLKLGDSAVTETWSYAFQP